MSFSYSGDPSASDKDAVRFLIRDTVAATKEFEDEEIAYMLTTKGSVKGATLLALKTLAAKYATAVDKAVGDLRLSLSQKYDHYLSLIKQYEAEVMMVAIPFAGGISQASKEVYENDSDRIRPRFTKDLHEYDDIYQDGDGRED